MVYAFTVLGCLALISGLVGFHDVLHKGLPIVYALFSLFLLAWLVTGVAMIAKPLLRRWRARPKPAG
jgi:hypothetical protein